jgi:hypothetical protein
MEKDLGREEALRLLWPAVVGRPLSAQTRLDRIVNDGCGGTMLVSVSDGEWRGPIASLGQMILDRVNAFWGRVLAERIEFVVGPPRVTSSPVIAATVRERGSAERGRARPHSRSVRRENVAR